MKKLLILVLLTSIISPAMAYYHCYSEHCQIVRLQDKIKRLTKNLEHTADELKKAAIQVEIKEAEAEINSFTAAEQAKHSTNSY